MSDIAKSSIPFVSKIASTSYRVMRDSLLRHRKADLILESQPLPDREVWDIALRYPLTRAHLENIPSGNPVEQHEWLTGDMGGIPLGLRKDRITLYNRTRSPIKVRSIRVKVESVRNELYPTWLVSSAEGYYEERCFVARLKSTGLHPIFEAEAVGGRIDWSKASKDMALLRLTLESKEDFSFQLVTDAIDASVEWRLQVDYVHRSASGMSSAPRSIVHPSRESLPHLTANPTGPTGVEQWRTGLNGVTDADHRPKRPYFKRAK